ncbi:hypothetical protein [Aquirufa ecclesiirivi]|uniref:hypothetical protein n=1 Tax=Aquirufa ecclesiirivi TaxID=2715124 RepID=UPI003BAF4A5C
MVDIIETPIPYFSSEISREDVHLICGDFSQKYKTNSCIVHKMVPFNVDLEVLEFSYLSRKHFQVETMFPQLPITIIPPLGDDMFGVCKNPYIHYQIEYIYQLYLKKAIEIQNEVVKSSHVFFDFSNLYSSLARTELYRLVYQNRMEIKADKIEVLV